MNNWHFIKEKSDFNLAREIKELLSNLLYKRFIHKLLLTSIFKEKQILPSEQKYPHLALFYQTNLTLNIIVIQRIIQILSSPTRWNRAFIFIFSFYSCSPTWKEFQSRRIYSKANCCDFVLLVKYWYDNSWSCYWDPYKP